MLAKAGNDAVVSCTVDYGKEHFINAPIDEVYIWAVSHLRKQFESSYKYNVVKLSTNYRMAKKEMNSAFIKLNKSIKNRKRGRWCNDEHTYKILIAKKGKKYADKWFEDEEVDHTSETIEDLDADVKYYTECYNRHLYLFQKADFLLNPNTAKQEAWKEYLDNTGFTYEITVYGKDIIIFQKEEQECGNMYREFHLSDCPK